ncbi:hypothetical protein ACS0PU_001841 [Formica fusca]
MTVTWRETGTCVSGRHSSKICVIKGTFLVYRHLWDILLMLVEELQDLQHGLISVPLEMLMTFHERHVAPTKCAKMEEEEEVEEDVDDNNYDEFLWRFPI